MATSDFLYSGNGIHPGTSSQHPSLPPGTTVHPNDFHTGTYDSAPPGGTPDNNGNYEPALSPSFAGSGGSRELRNAPGPAAPSDGHAQYYVLNMSEFKNLEDTAISLRGTVRNNANKGGSLILFGYANYADVAALTSLPLNANHGEMYNRSKPGIYAVMSGQDNSMSVRAGFKNSNILDTYNPLNGLSNVSDYFGYNEIGDFTSIRLDIIPWIDGSGVKYVRLRLFQAARNYHPLSESSWQDYTRVSSTDPSPASVQNAANKISMVQMDKTFDEVFNQPSTSTLEDNPINGQGSVCGFGMQGASNYPGSDLNGYGRIGVTNFEVKILDQGI